MLFNSDKGQSIGLDDISLELDEAEIGLILGKTGAGKSTLLRTILGTLSPNAEIASGSTVVVGIQNVVTATKKQRRKLYQGILSNMPQNPLLALNPTLTCGRQVAEVLPGNAKHKRQTVLNLFERVSLPQGSDLYDAYPHQVSLGQLQRISLAMALASNPRLILVDEPFSSLDPGTTEKLVSLFEKIRDEGIGFLMITHDLEQVDRLADKWIWLDKGKIIAEGKTSLFEREMHLPEQVQRVIKAHQHVKSQRVEDVTQSSTPLLSLRSVSYRYLNRSFLSFRSREIKYALKNIDLDIFRGEVLGIVGSSGSGKSTLVKIIGGLLNDYQGERISFLPDGRYFDKVQYIMQDAATALPPRRSIGRILGDILSVHHPNSSGADRLHLKEMLMQDVGMPIATLEKSRFQLSGGEKQRILLARALAVHPQLIILDESLNALDRDVQKEMLRLIQALITKYDLSVILVSHDQLLIEHFCQRVIVMEHGLVKEEKHIKRGAQR